ncbi:MAG TPA: N-methyl-L-tryptophan oxidase [Gemmatimonadales bacterium]|nr:N-methyl-L-tryptophan oxidase [Gemmatimonadales bacterium]
MPRRFDVAVVGLGAVGSSALLALTRRGLKAVGVDRFTPPHSLGSSHGRSRIIREAYYESPVYVPLVRRAYELWRRLEVEAGRPLLRTTGGLMVGPADGALVRGSRRSAEQHGIPFEILDSVEVRRRYPVLEVRPDQVALLEPRAGVLDPEGCLEGTLSLAVRGGAELWDQTLMTAWRPAADGLTVGTSREMIECAALILALGPWHAESGGVPGVPLSIERQAMFWFEPKARAERFGTEQLPVFIWEWERGRFFYGIPDAGDGFKVAGHHEGRVVSPDQVERQVSDEEVDEMRRLLRRTIPLADGRLRDAATCLYTNTPDQHFALGPHPEDPRVVVASPCSGHGFKFASALGEILADLAMQAEPSFDITPFRLDRFALQPRSSLPAEDP